MEAPAPLLVRAETCPSSPKVRILFLPPVDADNTNAQSLNTREIALRLDSHCFESTLWYENEPDARLVNRPGVRLLRLPPRRKTLRILQEQFSRYDLIAYMDYSPASYVFVHAPRWLRRATTAMFHAEAPQEQLVNPSALLKWLYRGVLSHCDVYTGITDYVAKDLSTVSPRPARFILPVGVDSKFFRPPASRHNAIPNVLFVGTVIERKGPQLVLEAAARFPEARFRIVGAARDGYDSVLREIIRERQLNNVSLEGPRSQPEVLSIMRESDIFLLPSRLEGLPKVSLEAAATGLPCVLFDDYQTPSVVDGVTGFQVSTVGEMLQRVGQLIRNADLRARMSHAARKHAEGFDWDVIAKQWEEAYLAVAHRG